MMSANGISRQKILDHFAELSPEARVAAMTKLMAHNKRELNKLKYPTPGMLATALDKNVRQTPALELIDDALVRTLETGGRLGVTIPPQQGKSQRVAIWLPVWMLVRDPTKRIVVASYAESLAKRNAMAARAIVQSFGTGVVDPLTGRPLPDRLGIKLAEDNRAASSWAVEGDGGGMFAVGTGGALTGRSADALIIDDPLKDQVQADSAREREKVWEWWTAVAQTRLSPGAPVIIIQTRWHHDDLVGRIRDEEAQMPPSERTWEFINIPAIAEEGVPDALERAPGEPLISARGHTLDDWLRTKKQVGNRTWYSLYQGVPEPLEGGLFEQSELDAGRVDSIELAGRVVSVDPADSGRGDEAGILVMGWDENGTIYVEEDHSAPMTAQEWAVTAVHQVLTHRAGDLVFEAFTAEQTYRDVIMRAWHDFRRVAEIYRDHRGDYPSIAEQWYQEGGGGDVGKFIQTVETVVDRIHPENFEPPFKISGWRARGDKVARAAGARQSVSTGRLRMIGHHRVLENQARTWQPGQASPDRVDAMVNGHDYIMQMMGTTEADIAFPGDY